MKPTLALIDDDELLRVSVARALSPEFEVTTYGHAQPFLDEVAAGHHYDALMFDYRLPDMSGGALATKLAAVDRPLLTRSVLVTGRAPDEVDDDLFALINGRIVQKPFTFRALASLLLALASRPA